MVLGLGGVETQGQLELVEGICQSVVLKRQFAEGIVVCRGSGLRLVKLPSNLLIKRSFSLRVLIGRYRLVPLTFRCEVMACLSSGETHPASAESTKKPTPNTL